MSDSLSQGYKHVSHTTSRRGIKYYVSDDAEEREKIYIACGDLWGFFVRAGEVRCAGRNK